jgi:hypothetical protein
MRASLAILLLSAGTFISADYAAAQRWCAISNQGATNCGFASIDQCRSEVSGTGGSCTPEAPVGHLQPRAANARPAPRDEKLDALLERVNKKSDKIILCRGC